MRLPKIVIPLKNKDFVKLYISQIFNNSGIYFDFIAINALIIYQWHKGPKELAELGFSYSLPLILSVFAGALVDNWRLKRTMISSCFSVTILSFLLYFCSNIYELIAVLAIRTQVRMFYNPAEAATIKMMFKKEELLIANSLVSTTRQIFRILGPIIGALFLFVLHPKQIFLVTTCSYFISGLMIIFIPKKYNSKKSLQTTGNDTDSNKGILIMLLKAFKLYFGDIKLRLAFFSMFLTTFAMFCSDSLDIIFAESFGFNLHNFEWVLVAIGFGAFIAAFYMSRKGDLAGNILLKYILVGMAFAGVSFIFSSCVCHYFGSLSSIIFILSWIPAGIGFSLVSIPYSTLIMKIIPGNMIGKVSSISTICVGICLMLGPVIGATLSEWYDITIPFKLSGIILILGSIIFYIIFKLQINYTNIKPKEIE